MPELQFTSDWRLVNSADCPPRAWAAAHGSVTVNSMPGSDCRVWVIGCGSLARLYGHAATCGAVQCGRTRRGAPKRRIMLCGLTVDAALFLMMQAASTAILMSKDPGPRGMCPGVSENASTRAVETCPIPPRHGSDGPALDRPSDGKGVLDQTIWANVCAFRQQVADPRDVSARSNRAPGASRPEGNKTAPPLDDIPVPAPGGPASLSARLCRLRPRTSWHPVSSLTTAPRKLRMACLE